MSGTNCPKCGAMLRVGDFPFCPHGRSTLAAIGDDVPGGFWAENGFDTPRKFYSKSEHIAALAANGCELRPKYAGPNDRHMTNWAAGSVDLDAAKRLIARRWPLADVPITTEDTSVSFTVEREA